MKVSIWDTYVNREDGKTMHFDIVVPQDMTDAETVFGYGRHFLATKNYKTGKLTSEECQFCHIEQASDEMVRDINKQGYFIIEMQNCQ